MSTILFEIIRLKKALLLAVTTLVSLNIVFMVIIGVYQTPEIAVMQKKWSDLRRQVAVVGKADSETLYRQGTADLARLETRIPLKKEFARVLGDLLEAASTSGVTIGGINYKPLYIKEQNLLSYQLSLKVTGGYAASKSYISDLQKIPELVIIDTISLTNSDPFAENVAMDLHLTVYLRERE